MINRIFPDFETLEKETLAYAERVAENYDMAFTALQYNKQAVHHTRDLQGFTLACQDIWSISAPGRKPAGARRHTEREEGRGMARTPRALRRGPGAVCEMVHPGTAALLAQNLSFHPAPPRYVRRRDPVVPGRVSSQLRIDYSGPGLTKELRKFVRRLIDLRSVSPATGGDRP